MKKKLYFIINPISGVGRQKKVEKLISTCLDLSRFDYSVNYTKAPGHATELAAEAAERRCDAVVIAGGDGSVNEAGKALLGSNTALAILPAGSGNGLARHLGIPMDLEKAMAVIQGMKVMKADTGVLNGRPFMGMSGVGFDAHIGYEFSRFGKRGFASYVKVFLREFPKYRAKLYRIKVDGKEFERQAMLISVANGSQYGNNAWIAPKADIRDGLLDVCILKPFPIRAVPSLVRRLFRKTIDRSKYMETMRGREVQIIQQEETAHIDGEPFLAGWDVNISVNPLSLNLIVP